MEIESTKNKELIRVASMGYDNNADKFPSIFDQVPAPLEKSNFFYIISGKPGSGKTSLLMQMIAGKKNKVYNRLFDNVYMFSPSTATIDIPLPRNRLFTGLDMVELTKILSGIPKGTHNLFIFDDLASELRKNEKVFLKLILNRRHLSGSGGSLSIIITTQKYNLVSLAYRNAASSLILFDMNRKESKIVFDEVVSEFDTFQQWQAMLEGVYNQKHTFLLVRVTAERSHRYFRNFDRIIL